MAQDTSIKTDKKFIDANKLDKKIPQDLLMQYQGKWYILKAGLEWKANLLFGGGNYGVTTDIVERTPDFIIAKATFTTKSGMTFSNYGEASKTNVTPNMQKYLLHLAITRAECRVLRMATACGYTSVEEMEMSDKTLPQAEDDGDKATDAQLATIEQLGGSLEGIANKGEAKQRILELSTKK